MSYVKDGCHRSAVELKPAGRDAELARLRAELASVTADRDALRAANAMMRDWITGDATCPCCAETAECLDGCTFASDCPSEH